MNEKETVIIQSRNPNDYGKVLFCMKAMGGKQNVLLQDICTLKIHAQVHASSVPTEKDFMLQTSICVFQPEIISLK